MHLRYTIIAFLCPVIAVFAQPSSPTPLTIGDTVPDIPFQTVINHSSTSAHLSDFKGKLVILDFWATWCTSCLQSFPKMDSLQKEFGDHLQVLPINSQNTGDDSLKVEAFFKKWKHKYGKALDLPSAINDTIADKLFEHRLIPHYVWVSPEGKVIAVTSAGQVNATNIRSVIKSGSASFLMKKDQDTEKPLFSGSDLPATGLLNYVVLVKGWFDGLPSGSRIRRTGDIITGRSLTNAPLLDIYKAAIRGIKPGISERQIVSEVKDSSELLSPSYSVDIIVPVENANQLYTKMLDLLNNYSGYKGRFEKRKLRCWVLGRANKADRLKTKGGVSENKLWDVQRPYLKNGTMDMLVANLNTLTVTKQLVLDETRYNSRIDIVFSSGLHDMKTIQEELRRYGLILREAERNVEVFALFRIRSK